MRKILPFAIIGLFLFGGSLWAQQKKTTIAVLEFQRTGGLEASEAATLTNRFRGLLVQTEAFEVIERDKMGEILKEQDFTMSDQCNSAECAVQIGQLLGVQAMIAGDIGKLGQTWTIDVRMIDVSTGKILKTQNEDFKGEIDGLLQMMKKIAEKFAVVETAKGRDVVKDKGKEVVKEDKGKVKADKTKDDKGTAVGGTQVTKKGFSMKWVYIGAGVVAAGGAAAVLLGGGGGGGSKSPISEPTWPGDTN